MNPLDLLKTLAPGFLPLFAYLGAELFFGETVGLFVGIGLGVAEFLFRLIKDKKADLFALAETILLAAMGALSLFSGNSIFFRLKPAITEGIMALGMAVLLFLPAQILKAYFSRQVKGIKFGEEAMKSLRKNVVLILGILLLHTGLTIWAALAASAAIWAFVSGGLLYILISVVFTWRIIGARRKARLERSGPRLSGPRLNGPPLREVPVLEWRIVLFDEVGRIFVVRQGRDPMDRWDNPLSGRASSLAEMQEKMSSGIMRLGFGTTEPNTTQQRLSLRPLFLADGKGGLVVGKGNLAADTSMPFDPTTLFISPGLGEGWAVFAVVLPSALCPKGLDPTLARFWSLADLVALKNGSLFSSDFTALIGSLAALRNSLRNPTADL